MEMAFEEQPSKARKMAVSAAVGAVVGALAMIGFIRLSDSGALGDSGPSEQVAAIVGGVYVLIAAQIGVGLAVPGIGTRFLNFEDADELREQRRMLALAAAAMAAMGGALVVLALAGSGGIVAPTAGLTMALVLVALAGLLTIAQWRQMDELMRGMSQECGNLSFYLVMLLGGGWAMLAHLGLATAPAPLDWLTMFLGLTLVAAFLAVGRRGMLMPR